MSTLSEALPLLRKYKIGASTETGDRPSNEDRYRIEEVEEDLLLLGIFDGHQGSLASDLASRSITRFFPRDPQRGLAERLKEAFRLTDDLICKELTSKRSEFCGTTATVALIHQQRRIVVGHVGDTRAVLCRSGVALPLTTDHRPYIPAEQARIEQAGSFVDRQRVEGMLMMSRAMGSLWGKKRGVISEPQIVEQDLSENDTALLLGSDGVFDAISNQTAADVINQANTPAEAASKLSLMGLSSHDNSTAVVLALEGWVKKPQTSFGLYGRDGAQQRIFGKNVNIPPSLFIEISNGRISHQELVDKVFEYCDRSKEGLLSRDEVYDAMLSMGHHLSKEALDEIFLDEVDGTITRKVFNEWLSRSFTILDE